MPKRPSAAGQCFDRLNADRLKRNLVSRLERLGYRVTVQEKVA